ncbi:hypothetical protein EV560_1021 [Bosea sp. BK604]|nr:hypothetical protein EV560_1021 [Bosea sp. BK604]
MAMSLVNYSRPRICIRCVREGRTKPEWDVFGNLACPDHLAYLVDECGCRLPATWFRRGPLRCKCRRELQEDLGRPEDVLLRTSQLFSDLAHGRPPAQDAAPIEGVEAAAKLLRFCAAFDHDPGWRATYIGKPSARNSRTAIQKASPILWSWPEGLKCWLDRRRLASEGQVSLNLAYGRLYESMRSTLDNQGLRRVRAEVNSYFGACPEAVFLKNRAMSANIMGSRQSYVLTQWAAKRLGVSSKAVARMVESGQLKGERRAGKRRRHYLVSANSVNELHSRMRVALGFRQVAESLGIRPEELTKLMEERVIAPFFVLGTQSLFDCCDVEKLAARLAKVE